MGGPPRTAASFYSANMCTFATNITYITNILINVSKNCLKLSKIQKKKKKNNKSKEYFDSECYLKRKELQRLGRLLSSDPNNISIRNTYFQTKKHYKNMIKVKKRNCKEEKLKLLASIGNNDMKLKSENYQINN